jgi:hypothetical protein
MTPSEIVSEAPVLPICLIKGLCPLGRFFFYSSHIYGDITIARLGLDMDTLLSITFGVSLLKIDTEQNKEDHVNTVDNQHSRKGSLLNNRSVKSLSLSHLAEG